MTDNAKAPVMQRTYFDPQAGDDQPAGNEGAATGGEGEAAGGTGEGDQEGTPPGGDFEIPEKFLVKNDAGEIDHKSTMEKMGQSYKELEKRIGTGDLPPKSADEYKLEKYLPDGYEPNQEVMKPMLAKMHALHLTNAQVQGVLGLYGEALSTGLNQEKASMESAMEHLKEHWGSEAARNNEIANMVIDSIADEEEKKALSDPKVANNPYLQRLLAKLGKEIFDEDTLPNEMGAESEENLKSLRKDPSYWDEKHPDHKATVEKVNAIYRQQAAQQK